MEQLSPKQLRPRVDPESIPFSSLKAVEEGVPVFGQDRAVRAMELGLDLDQHGFNIFVAGSREAGAMDLAMSMVSEMASRKECDPSDWIYLHNFLDPDSPIAVRLKAGDARSFKADMEELIDNLRLQIPKAFESESYLVRKEEVIRQFNKERTAIFEELDKKAKEKGFLLQADPTGMMVIPAGKEGQPLTPDELSKLSEEEQNQLKAKSEELHREMGSAMRKIHGLEQQVQQRLKELDRQVVDNTVEAYINQLKEKYSRYPQIQTYLDQVRQDIVLHHRDFRPPKEPPPGLPFPMPGAAPSFTRYEVNILVDNSDKQGCPVVVENNPSYPNLFGVIERQAQFGALLTDFTMIKSGSLHRANGGFLILKALDLLKRPFSYEALKRALNQGEIEIEDLGEQYGLFTTKTLKPRPIELQVKIVLVGDPFIYQLLYSMDEEFKELFKIKAHLDVHVDASDEYEIQFLKSARYVLESRGLLDVDRPGMARLLEMCRELSGYQDKISLRVKELEEILIEADFWARKQGAQTISAPHLQKALDEKRYRSALYQEHLQELLERDIIRVETSGEKPGQINGLAVYNLGDAVFGKPSRITVNVSLGKDGVVNIEREAELSGKIHTKGVMILAGYLRAAFAAKFPMTLRATICFEQSYGMIDGDSASGAELFALLSAISGVPVKQAIACTGAVSQKGEILPVGGVTEKIEGFFDLCRARGLDGSHGVIIPKANVRDLHLRQEVVDAVAQGKFSIWAIERVEEGVELLTGMEAGSPDQEGIYPEETLFGRVQKGLKEMFETAKRLSSKEKEDEG